MRSIATETLLLLLFGAFVCCIATSDPNSRFLDNNLLTCLVPGPNGISVPENRFRVPFQPGLHGTAWLPQLSIYNRPRREKLKDAVLLQFLRSAAEFDNLDLQFLGTSSTAPPREVPPLAARRLPVQAPNGSFIGIFPPDPLPQPIFFDSDPDDVDVVLGYIRDVGLGQCDLLADWVRLNDTYFPYYYSASRCVNANEAISCSFPGGLRCEPDISTTIRMAYITVLRWDCCYVYVVDTNRFWRWECGWRQVEIPIIVDCICACQAKVPV